MPHKLTFCTLEEHAVTAARRPTKAEMRVLKDAFYELLASHHPQTARQLFYQAVAAGLIEKTEAD